MSWSQYYHRAFTRGYHAARAGFDRSANPHAPNSRMAHDWNVGWLSFHTYWE